MDDFPKAVQGVEAVTEFGVISINCVRCGVAVETDCPDLMKYCDDCWRDVQHELSQPYIPKRADQLSEIDLLSRDITHEIIFEEKRLKNWIYPIKPTRLRGRKPEATHGHPGYSSEVWMEECDADRSEQIAHQMEAENHIHRIRGRNC